MYSQCFPSIFVKFSNLCSTPYDSQCHQQNSQEQGAQSKFVSQSQSLQVTWSWPIYRNRARPREEGGFSTLNLCIQQDSSSRAELYINIYTHTRIYTHTYIYVKITKASSGYLSSHPPFSTFFVLIGGKSI